VDQTNIRIQALAPLAGSDEPTVGAIKRALHELARTISGLAPGDRGSNLREAHDLLRQLARRNGINPDDAVRRSRAAIKPGRVRLVCASATVPDTTSS
jgi:hypothetical protein